MDRNVILPKLKAGETMLCQERIYVLCGAVSETARLGGEVWECGVYSGGSALRIANTIQQFKKPSIFRLFDSFTGIKSSDPSRDTVHRDGDFGDADYDGLTKLLAPFQFLYIHKGHIPSTFKGLETCKISIAHIDVDVYNSTLDCLNFIWPRLLVGGVIVIDDYFASTCHGCTAAVDWLIASVPCQSSKGIFPQIILTKT